MKLKKYYSLICTHSDEYSQMHIIESLELGLACPSCSYLFHLFFPDSFSTLFCISHMFHYEVAQCTHLLNCFPFFSGNHRCFWDAKELKNIAFKNTHLSCKNLNLSGI